MTRLTTDVIESITDQLHTYDEELIGKTGRTLAGIACRAAGMSKAHFKQIAASVRVGIVPITFGRGVIPGFCETVADIVSHLGCRALVAQQADVAGLAEVFERKADILMLADDERFVAINAASRQIVDNAVATAEGYVVGLDLMAGGLKQKKVLVLGCGPVGTAAAHALVGKDAVVSVYDVDPSCSQGAADRIRQKTDTQINIEEEFDHALTGHRFIIDATPAGGIIRAAHVSPQTYVSAPGVPVGLDKEAQVKISKQLLHDPLQIGVATMVACSMNHPAANNGVSIGNFYSPQGAGN
jgi:pyrrolysine biosynthesis protein PylD